MFGFGKKKQVEELNKNFTENIAKMQSIYQKIMDLIISDVESYEQEIRIIDETIDGALKNSTDRSCVNKCIVLKSDIEKALEVIGQYKDPIVEMFNDEFFDMFDEDIKASGRALFNRIEILENTYKEKLDETIKVATKNDVLCSIYEKYEEKKNIIKEQQKNIENTICLLKVTYAIKKELKNNNIEDDRRQILVAAYEDICLNFKTILDDENRYNYYMHL